MALEHEEATDAMLMVRYQRGNREAFVELVERHHGRVYNYTRRMVGQPALAEALTERAFLRVVKNAGDFKHESRFATWLYAIVRNVCREAEQERHSPEARSASHSAEDRPRADGAREDEVLQTNVVRNTESTDIPSAVARAVEALPPESREVFLLRQIANLPIAEIALATDADDAAVRHRLRAALDRLEDALLGFEEYTRALR